MSRRRLPHQSIGRLEGEILAYQQEIASLFPAPGPLRPFAQAHRDALIAVIEALRQQIKVLCQPSPVDGLPLFTLEAPKL